MKIITDKQFDIAYTSAGAWFVAKFIGPTIANIEEFNERKEAKTGFIKEIFNNGNGPDNDISGTRVRVNCVMRIINAGRSVEALEKVVNSNLVAKRSPEEFKIAEKLLAKLINGN